MSRNRNHSKMSAKKKLAALMSLVLVGALLIGGAFAWTDFSQSFINRFRGGVTPDVLLHDDFEPWLNKDVYVENTGEQDLIVRVKFNEFLQIGNKVIVGDDANDKDEWDTHLFTEAPEYGSGDPDSEDYGLCYDCALETHTYFQWYMTGAKKTYLHGTSEQGNEDWEGQPTEDEDTTGPNGMMFGETQEASEIMTMQEWIASDMSAACWVLDTDGWAYWSQALAPTKATNLLLDNVKLIQKPDDNFYYAIDVILNATNLTEAYKLENPTTEAEEYILSTIINGIDHFRNVVFDSVYSQAGTMQEGKLQHPDGGYFEYGATAEGVDVATNKLDAYAAKYSEDGTEIWRKTVGGSGYDKYHKLIYDPSDNSVVAMGNMVGPENWFNPDNVDILLTKYSDDGEVVWTKTFGSDYDDFLFRMLRDENGDFVIIGHSSGKCEPYWDDDSRSTQALIIKFNSDGEIMHATLYGNSNIDIFGDFFLLPNGTNEFIVSGYKDNIATVFRLKIDTNNELVVLDTGSAPDRDNDIVGITQVNSDSGKAYYVGISNPGILYVFNENLDFLWSENYGSEFPFFGGIISDTEQILVCGMDSNSDAAVCKFDIDFRKKTFTLDQTWTKVAGGDKEDMFLKMEITGNELVLYGYTYGDSQSPLWTYSNTIPGYPDTVVVKYKLS